MSINAFSEIEFDNFVLGTLEQIKEDIESNGKQYILNINEEEYKKYLMERYILEPIEIKMDSEEIISEVIKDRFYDKRWHRNIEKEVYLFTIKYHFSGTPILFKLIPNPRKMTTNKIFVNEESSIVSYQLKLSDKSAEEFNRKKSEYFSHSFSNLNNINKNAEGWNKSLNNHINSLFNTIKQKYLAENEFFAAINVNVNKDTQTIFNAPTVKKRIIPQPPNISQKKYFPEPTMSTEMYEDILKVIYDAGKNMEKKPSLYIGKDEEGLRDQFLFILETRYEGTTATGETFNRSGKTDILLKYAEDGSNLFVAECKFWHGSEEFHKGIYQLLERYLTWRDSKVSLLIFVRNKNIVNVLEKINTEIKLNKYYSNNLEARGESSYSYIFKLPQDINKEIFLSILVFHYDKII